MMKDDFSATQSNKLPFLRSIEFQSICRVFSNSRYVLNLYFVSSNLAKVSHFQHLFNLYGIPLKVYSHMLRRYRENHALDPDAAIKQSLSEVARKLRHLGLFFIEDSSFVINALSSEGKEFPDLATKDFLKNNQFSKIDDLIKSHGNNRKAGLISRIGLHLPGGVGSEVFTGITNGRIADEYDGKAFVSGIPWLDEKSPANFFIPEGYSIPLSEIPLELSYNYDTRLNALHKLLFRLAQFESISEYSNIALLKKQIFDFKQVRLFGPLVLIISGYTGAGKSTSAIYVSRKYQLQYFEQSDAVRAAAAEADWPTNDLNSFCNTQIAKNGSLYLIRYLLNMHSNSLDFPFVISGVRSPDEVDYLKSVFPNTKLIFLDVSDDLRFSRRCLVGLSSPDKPHEYEALECQERLWGMEAIRDKADIVIPNIGNVHKLFHDLDKIAKKLI